MSYKISSFYCIEQINKERPNKNKKKPTLRPSQ